MDRQTLQQAIDRRIGAIRIPAAALAASVVFYAVTAVLVIEMLDMQPIIELAPPTAWSIAISALFVILIGYITERSIRSRAASGQSSGGVSSPGAGQSRGGSSSSSPGESSPGRGSSQRADALINIYTRSVIIAFAFREAAGVMGLVLSLLTADPKFALLLSGASLGSMLIHWPRRAAVENWMFGQRMV